MPDQLVNLDMKHGVEAKNYEEVSVGARTVLFTADTADKESVCSL